MAPRVNLRSSAVKRIMQEAAELADPDTDDFVAAPLESDIFEWHCTLRGVPGTDYEGGLYHLRIILPPSYPMSAPDIMLMTPSGRFELGKKICIDGLTSFHAGSWQPAWGVRTAITGLRAFWTQDGEALSAIGALDYPKEERRRLARVSREWTCPTCNEPNLALLPDPKKVAVAKAQASGSGSTAGVEATTTGPAGESSAKAANGEDAGGVGADTSAAVAATGAAAAVHHNGNGDAAAHGQRTPPRVVATSSRAPAPPPPAPAPAAALPPLPPTPHAPSPAPPVQPRQPPPAPAPAPAAATPELPAHYHPAAVAVVPAHFTNPPAPPAVTPTRGAGQRRRGAPLWLDILIGALVMLLFALLARR